MNTAPGQRGYVISQEAGTWVGGWYGASWGMAAGVAGAVALGATPVGWALFATGIGGGIIGGMTGANIGSWGAGTAYKGITTWFK